MIIDGVADGGVHRRGTDYKQDDQGRGGWRVEGDKMRRNGDGRCDS